MLSSLIRRLTGQRSEPVRSAVSLPSPAEETRAETAATAASAEMPADTDLLVSSLEAPALAAGMGKSPVFSSRAVRDATVVTGTIESLTRFVDGQDVLDDLTWRLESLTPDQVNFLQLSAEPGLIQRAQARSEVLKGAKAAAARKLLTDLASGAIPEPLNRTNPLSLPKGPIVPPLASLQPRPVTAPADPVAAPASGPGPAVPPPASPGMPSLTTAPPLATRPIPPAPAKPVTPPPTPPSTSPVTPSAPRLGLGVAPPRPEPAMAKAPEPKPAEFRAPEPTPMVKAAEPAAKVLDAPAERTAAKPVEPDAAVTPAAPAPAAKASVTVPVATQADPAATLAVPPPASVVSPPSPKVPEPVKTPDLPKAVEAPRAGPVPEPPPALPSVPRLGRHDAEARRSRLLASLNDTLSSSEAAP